MSKDISDLEDRIEILDAVLEGLTQDKGRFLEIVASHDARLQQIIGVILEDNGELAEAELLSLREQQKVEDERRIDILNEIDEVEHNIAIQKSEHKEFVSQLKLLKSLQAQGSQEPSFATKAATPERLASWADYMELDDEERVHLDELIGLKVNLDSERPKEENTDIKLPLNFDKCYPRWAEIVQKCATFLGRKIVYSTAVTIPIAGNSMQILTARESSAAAKKEHLESLKVSKSDLYPVFMNIDRMFQFFVKPPNYADPQVKLSSSELWLTGRILGDFQREICEDNYDQKLFALGCKAPADCREQVKKHLLLCCTAGDMKPAAELILGAVDSILFGFVKKVYRNIKEEGRTLIMNMTNRLRASNGLIKQRCLRKAKVETKVAVNKGKKKVEETVTKMSLIPIKISVQTALLSPDESTVVETINTFMKDHFDGELCLAEDDETDFLTQAAKVYNSVEACYKITDDWNRVLKIRSNKVRLAAHAEYKVEERVKLSPTQWETSAATFMGVEAVRKQESLALLNRFSVVNENGKRILMSVTRILKTLTDIVDQCEDSVETFSVTSAVNVRFNLHEKEEPNKNARSRKGRRVD